MVHGRLVKIEDYYVDLSRCDARSSADQKRKVKAVE